MNLTLPGRKLPVCERCHGLGFVDCPEAFNPDGIFISVAWAKAVPCTCAAGEQFLRDQLEWNRLPEVAPPTPEQWRAARQRQGLL